MPLKHGFGVIQNNIALKPYEFLSDPPIRFGVIQNNIALKLRPRTSLRLQSFGVIQNNIALKRSIFQ